MQIIAIANQKGGVGKTATTHALGVLLARDHGRRVLLVDCDPQASLSGACGIGDVAGRSLAEVLGGATPGTLSLGEIIQELGDGLAIAPGDIALAGVELGLVSRMGRENTLKRALATVKGYDVALIDCPPSMGLLVVNALTAAQGVLIPTQPEIMALRGLSLFLTSLSQVREALNPELQIVGIVPTFFDGRLNHHRDALDAMRQGGLPLLDVILGRSVKVAEAAGFGETVLTYDPRNKRVSEFVALGEAVNLWLDENRR